MALFGIESPGLTSSLAIGENGRKRGGGSGRMKFSSRAGTKGV
jgi:hypothetical protein